MAYKALYRKYRPATFEDVVGHYRMQLKTTNWRMPIYFVVQEEPEKRQ